MADLDRLQQLRQQRAKIAEHLAWLDSEIAKTGHTDSPAREPSKGNLKLRATAPVTTPIQLESNNPSPAVSANPDAVLEEWVESSGPKPPPISKKGCWLVFGVLVATGIIATIVVIQFFYNQLPDS